VTLSLDDGKTAVRIARETLDAHVSGKQVKPGSWTGGTFSEHRGVFVTINLASSGPEKLRGCIGFPYPIKPLGRAIQEATIAASSEDPRFPPVTPEELDSVVLEVSILTQPKAIKASRPQDLPSMVRIGVDGLIVSRRGYSGLLLPQVATEYAMDQSEFLSQTCMKAGLLPDSWLDKDTEVQTFQAEIFGEKNPRGEATMMSTSKE
jgi:hypothetical protein